MKTRLELITADQSSTRQCGDKGKSTEILERTGKPSSALDQCSTHPEVEEDAEEHERSQEASGQSSHKLGTLLGRDNLSVPFSAGRIVTAQL